MNSEKVKSRTLTHSGFLAPQTGLEPVTLRLTAACSTDWAIEEYMWTAEAVHLCRHRPIFPGRRQPSIVGTGELNFRVRYGNGWTLTVISTDYQVLYHKSFQFAIPAPSKLNKDWRSKAHTSLSLLVPYISWSSPRLISTSQLNALLHLHLWPINVIVSHGSYHFWGKSYLEGGFALRCFQRLSRPYLATQLCRWHDNWCTRGMSIPVLSY